MPNITTFTFVFIGGALGSLLRWSLGSAIGERYTGKFPLGTFVINVTGAFVMGFLSTLMGVDWRDRFGNTFTALVLTGVLGGYTTFSRRIGQCYGLQQSRAWHRFSILGGFRSSWTFSGCVGLVDCHSNQIVG